MRVNLGTIEVNDRTRKAIRHYHGVKRGLATKKEIKETVEDIFATFATKAIQDLEQAEEAGRAADSKWSLVTYYAEDKQTRLDTPRVLSTHNKRHVAETKLRSKRRGNKPVLLRNDYTGQLYTWTKSTGVSRLPMDT